MAEPARTDPSLPALLAQCGLKRLFVIPHTHWDREWYRPLEYFRLALGQVVDEVIEVLDRDVAFRSFTLDGQAIVLEDYTEIRPQNDGRLRALLAAGRIEVGPSYVLPDELLVGAESLVRNLLIGRAVCERFGAAPSAVGYLPDSFGHPAQLPQILAGFGIGTLVFSRGLGDELDDVGVVFRWRAPDGSQVLAFQQLADYSNFAALAGTDDAAARVAGIVERFGAALERAGVHDLLLCNGSDHLPVQPELPRWCAQLERRLPGSQVTIASFGEYVDAVGPVSVPCHEGELLGSRLQNVLRGVNSARLYIKQANERAERRLLEVETLAALAALRDRGPFPNSDFTFAWRELLRCHPHDSICGCSCDEVHRDMLVRYESLDRTLASSQARALGRPTPADGAARVAVVNPLPYRRRAVVEIPGTEPEAVELDGFAARTVELRPATQPRPADRQTIETDIFRVSASSDGTLAVLDKRTGRRLERVHVLEDEPDMGDLYNFCPVPDAAPWRSQSAAVRVLRDGPLISELELDVGAERPSGLDADGTEALTVTTVVRLVRGSRRVEFRTMVDNRTRDHRLRVVFGGHGAHSPVRAEGHFAVVRRPLVPPPPAAAWVEPPDATQHTLGAVSVGAIAVLTKGLPEYEPHTDGALSLTLLRCVGTISKGQDALPTRPRAAGPPVQTPEGQCLGRHEFEYALLTDADMLDDAALLRESQDYRYGFVAVDEGVDFEPPLTLEGNFVFSCLKGAEDGDGLILRCFNPGGSPASARLSGPVSVSETRLDETHERPLDGDVVGLGAYQVATLRLRPEPDIV